VKIQKALQDAHQTYPKKPLLVLEYGRWSDNPDEDPAQLRVFNTYYSQLSSAFSSESGGFVSAGVWWSLDDYWTEKPGLTVENFGLFRPDGSLRPVGTAVARTYALTAPPSPPQNVTSGGVAIAIQAGPRHNLLWSYLAYGLAVPVIILVVAIGLLSLMRRRAW
jgi:hypothetical protein